MKAGTVTHIKFKELKRRLKLPDCFVTGVLESLWNLAATSAKDGAIGKFSNESIAASIEWPGDAEELIAALVACGWLDEDPTHRLVIHDWDDHCPNYVKAALKNSRRTYSDQQKAGLKQGCPVPSPVPSTGPSTEPETVLATVPPSQVKSSQANSKEAQASLASSPRRENASSATATDESEIAEVRESPGSEADREEPPEKPPEKPPPKTLVEFPCDGKPRSWSFTQTHANELAEAFPSLDVLAEAKQAKAWILASPERRKTARGMPRFLTNWLAKSQARNRAPPPHATPAKNVPRPLTDEDFALCQ